MNIKITYNWLLDYLDTNADPYEIQKYLSLCGPAIERVEKVEDDYIFDVEVTSNRVDMASVLGIAIEGQAILPQFGKKARLKANPFMLYRFKNLEKISKPRYDLDVKIAKPELCPRFTAIVMDNVEIKPSPGIIANRLSMCDIRSINNVVDISNYLMLALGQPVHMFDYKKISRSTMKIRLSKKGEKITTLDEKELTLPGGDIIIEDGDRNIIDLCGIMGGKNSAVSFNTDTVILFVQSYKKENIRRTSMITGQRTIAATYFEKGLDSERVEPTLVYGTELIREYAGGAIASKLYDIYPKTLYRSYAGLSRLNRDQKQLRASYTRANSFASGIKTKTIKTTFDFINSRIGVKIPPKKITDILTRLYFKVKSNQKNLQATPPSFRQIDVTIPEDIVEEVARIYGYDNLPNEIQKTAFVKQPEAVERLFVYQQKIKYFLKHLGLNEVMNYSMVSREIIKQMGLSVSDHLRIRNSISEEIEYMRTHITYSLIRNIKENEGRREILRFFEIAKGYKPQKNDLPNEYYQLAIAVNTSFSDLKGILDALLLELNVTNYHIKRDSHGLFDPNLQGEITIESDLIAIFGKLKTAYKIENELKSDVFAAYLKFEELIRYAKPFASYIPVHPYAVIKLDLTIEVDPKRPFLSLKEKALKASTLLKKIEFLDVFKNRITLRFYFASNVKNITDEEAKNELEIIKKAIAA